MVGVADGKESSKKRCLCMQVVTVGRDGAINVVAVDHSGPPPAHFVRARASVSMRAVAWASQQTLVTAGTTGKPPSSITSGHVMRLNKLVPCILLSSHAPEVVFAPVSWLCVLQC